MGMLRFPGATKLHRLEENIRAVAVELTDDDLRDIDAEASKIAANGACYPEQLEQNILESSDANYYAGSSSD
jgi:hypothetical protein